MILDCDVCQTIAALALYFALEALEGKKNTPGWSRGTLFTNSFDMVANNSGVSHGFVGESFKS